MFFINRIPKIVLKKPGKDFFVNSLTGVTDAATAGGLQERLSSKE